MKRKDLEKRIRKLEIRNWLFLALFLIIAIILHVEVLDTFGKEKNFLSGEVNIIQVDHIQGFVQGTKLFCDDHLTIQELDCVGCSYWVHGRGTCAYKGEIR
jgi:hypothetical protein